MKTKTKISGYILRRSAAALLFSGAIVALCSAINLPEQHPKTLAPPDNAAFSGSYTVTGPGPTCVPPPPDMVSWWPGDGNADDITGSNNGAFVGNSSFSTGEVDQAFSFDGSN